MKLDRSRSLWPTAAIAGAAALLSLYDRAPAMLLRSRLAPIAPRRPARSRSRTRPRRRASTFASGRRRRAARIRTIRWRRPMERFGTPARRPICSAARSAPEGAEFPLKEPIPARMDSSRTIRSDMVHAQAKGYIGKLDPASGEVREYIRKARGASILTRDLRQERRAVVHRARRQSDWAPRSVERRDRVAFRRRRTRRLTASYSARRRALCRRIRRE